MSERIRELFQRIKQDPSDTAAIQELDALMRDEADWPSLLDLYVYLAEAAEDETEASSLFRNAAVIAEENLDDPIRAIEFLNQSLEGDEVAILGTLSEMRRLLIRIEDWENYVEVAQSELEMLEDADEAAELLNEMGQTFETRIGD